MPYVVMPKVSEDHMGIVVSLISGIFSLMIALIRGIFSIMTTLVRAVSR
jgi:hypothetical protein